MGMQMNKTVLFTYLFRNSMTPSKSQISRKSNQSFIKGDGIIGLKAFVAVQIVLMFAESKYDLGTKYSSFGSNGFKFLK